MARLLALLLACALCSAAPAQPTARVDAGSGSGNLTLDVALGFSGVYRFGRWAPVTVTVHNRGAAVSGTLELTAVTGDDLRGTRIETTYRQPLELPRDARKRLRFTIRLESFGHPLSVRVTDGGRDLLQREIDLRGGFTDSRLVLVLGRDVDLDYLNDATDKTRRVLYPHPDLLPDRWHGYDGVDAVVMHGFSLDRLSEREHEALGRWVSAGGVLAVSGGPDYALLRTPRMADLLPAVPEGLATLRGGAALDEALGAPVHAPRPFDVNLVRRDRLAGAARVLRSAGGVPLALEVPRGRGRVVYLTFDVTRYPFDTWPGMADTWLEVLRLPEPEPRRLVPPAHDAEVDLVLELLRDEVPGFPGHGVVIGFLALYLGLLATAYHLRETNAIERALRRWTPVLLPLLLIPIAWYVFGPLLWPGGATAIVVSRIEPVPGIDAARVHHALGLVSNRTGTLRLDYEGAEPAFRALVPTADAPTVTRWVSEVGGNLALATTDPRSYTLHELVADDVVDFSLRAVARETATGLAVELANLSGRTLDHAWLVVDGRAYSLGRVGAEADLERTFATPADGIATPDDDWSATVAGCCETVRRDRRAHETIVEQAVQAWRAEHPPRADRGMLVAFSASPLRLARHRPDWRLRELGVVVMPVAVTRRPSAAPTDPGDRLEGEPRHGASDSRPARGDD
ncbi:MAG: hypothetical protein H6983_02265 [Ectothiorhodospiraceae bacterium]|nr:hypothetical protein [Ectothiorhodospiraceae bacterium]